MANRYWVGGSGTWDTTATANWSATSGGASGASAPTSADDVFIDASSGGGTVTLGENVSIKSLTLTGFTGTLNWVTYKISLLGTAAVVFTGATTYTVAGTAVIDLAANATTSQRTVTSTSITEANAVSVLVSAGSDTVVIGNRVKSLDFTGFSGTFSNTSRTLYGSLTLSATMTLTAGANATNLRGSTGSFTVTSNGKTMDFPLSFDAGAGTYTLTDALTIGTSRAFDLTSGTLNLDGKTLTTGLFVSSNSNVRTLAFGTGNITVTGNNGIVFTCGNRTNLTLTGSANVYSTYSGATGTRTINLDAGGGTYATRINLFVTAGTDTVTTTGNSNGTLDFTGFAGTWALGSFASNYRGGLILNSTMTVNSGTNTLQTFNATADTHLIDLAGKTIDCPVTFNGAGGTWRFTGAFAIGSTRALTLTNGTLDANGNNASIGTFALGSGTKTLTLGSGTWTVAGATWNANTNVANLTVSASTGAISMTSASAKTFSGGAKVWPTLNQGGAGNLTIAQSNTFANITNTVQPATIRLTAGTTQTVSAFSVSGTSGNLITLDTTVAGTQATLSDPSGLVSVSFCSIKDINATGGAFWQAYTANGNVDAGNNLGWDFNALAWSYMYNVRKSKRILPGV